MSTAWLPTLQSDEVFETSSAEDDTNLYSAEDRIPHCDHTPQLRLTGNRQWTTWVIPLQSMLVAFDDKRFYIGHISDTNSRTLKLSNA
ncbi:hypothetical protein M8J75_010840 [Diaphorina citri]|nr:hypothetical protein M8J75_010840 [Diaphorina citri]